MTAHILRTGWMVLAFLLAVAALAGGVWRYGYLQALDQLAHRAESDLALASDRLGAQLQNYQELAVLTASHPALDGLDDPARAAAADVLLRATADKTGAMDVLFADTNGRVLAAARDGARPDLRAAPYFRRAMQGALGSGHGTDAESGRRVFAFAVPAFDARGQVRGALTFIADAELVEQAWRGDTPAVFFTDAAGEVFISNRDELLFWHRPPGAPGLAPAAGD
ncbi:cache domain-containing protein, partial [Pseudooceanicola sp.]|uniref:cache domain-containing protein n=1 Tax=Pseudooceanicola sp. TaxID=1914328 RepID=UPI0035111CA8